MARHAIFSDVHANLEALVAVYRDFSKLDSLGSVVSLGDLVGYGPNPAEAIAGLNALVKKGYAVRYCMGNHDGAAIGRFEFVDLRDPRDLELLAREAGLKDFQAIARHFQDQQRRKYVPVSLNAKVSIQWTRQRLTEPFRQFLAQQSQEHVVLGDGVICIHASPRDPLFDYVTNPKRARHAMEAPLMAGVGLCFIGHTHIPGIWQLPAEDLVRFAGNVVVMHPPKHLVATQLKLNLDETITMVNVGSVGQPRDGDPRACYVVYDDAEQTIELRRVPYDFAATRQKIVAAGLPKSLADRLGSADAEKAGAGEDDENDD
jgi:diadenosine tetraphosphatase ApaH/serine/threonine PP2A family protein phosphatase